MKGCLLLFALASAVAFGQEQTQSGSPQLNPNRARALENALRAPNFFAKQGPSAKPALPFLSASRLLPPRPLQTARLLPPVAPMGACAIPLLRVPVDSKMDPGIGLQIKSGAPPDNMPFIKGLPVCPDDHPLH